MENLSRQIMYGREFPKRYNHSESDYIKNFGGKEMNC